MAETEDKITQESPLLRPAVHAPAPLELAETFRGRAIEQALAVRLVVKLLNPAQVAEADWRLAKMAAERATAFLISQGVIKPKPIPKELELNPTH